MTETPDNRATDPRDQPADSAPAFAPPSMPEPSATEADAPGSQPRQEQPSSASQAESAVSDPTTPLPSMQPEPTRPLSSEPAPSSPAPIPSAQAPTTQMPAQQLQSPAGPAPLPAAPVWGAPQPQPQQAQYPQQPPVWGAAPAAAPVPSGQGTPPPPNWAAPASTGLPPYGTDPNAPTGPAEPKRPSARLAIVTAVIAGLIGGGLGAGITYAVKDDNGSTASSSSLVGSTNSSGSSNLNSTSANANAVTAAVAKILPSVVTISVVNNSDGSGDEGSGIIISSTGQILTNNHVIAAAASGGSTSTTMTVTFASGKITPAKIVGRDTTSDLAVIQASGVSGLTPATLGDSSSVAVGQNVVAVGAPLGLSNTVTTGIVSALNRPVTPASDSGSQSSSTSAVLDAIQTDASINPGNSGGPLVDLSGAVVGINSAIATASSDTLGGSSQSGSIGLGFAIPINQAKWIADELIKTGTAQHSLLGVSVTDPSTSATQAGAVVSTVSSGSAADKAGIKKNDVITKVDDQQIASADSLQAAIRSYKPGTAVTITYVRGGQASTTQATLLAATS